MLPHRTSSSSVFWGNVRSCGGSLLTFSSLARQGKTCFAGFPEPQGAGVGRKECIRGHVQIELLALRPVDRGRRRRPPAHAQGQAHLLPLKVAQRVLERAAGEGLRQVS